MAQLSRRVIGIIQRAAKAIGVEIRKYPRTPWTWSDNVDAYYPVTPSPRWGHGKPPHPQLTKVFDAQRDIFLQNLSNFSSVNDILNSIPAQGDPSGTEPFWKNDFFVHLDAGALISMLVQHKPKRYLEIGSGNSTKFTRYTINVR
jgi:hypothetical protein